MNLESLCNLQGPTEWASPPNIFSFSTLQSIRECPRRWQLVHSKWGEYPEFPTWLHPAALEGQIVHKAIDRLARELGRRGRPVVGSEEFRSALETCGFWDFFTKEIEKWNRNVESDSPTNLGFKSKIRVNPQELANQAIRLFRQQYHHSLADHLAYSAKAPNGIPEADSIPPLQLLQLRGALSEMRLQHPTLPFCGVIDLITRDEEGETVVVDFKTGAQKSIHQEQIRLSALLWWRAAGECPNKGIVQYLGSSSICEFEESQLASLEDSLENEIAELRASLVTRPAVAKPSSECKQCPVRTRCTEGWAVVKNSSIFSGSKSIDIEVTVVSDPTPFGFIGKLPDKDTVSIVFRQFVGKRLSQLRKEECLRICNATPRFEKSEIELMPWSELFVIRNVDSMN